jgi:hypothetical protein
MLKKLATFAGALTLASSVFAAKPACPSIDAIKSEGLSMASQLMENLFLTFHMSTYNSDNSWVFILGPVVAESEDGALEDGNVMLSMMNSQGVPEEDQDMYGCVYDTGSQDFGAAAILADQQMSPMRMRQFLHHAR